MCRTLPGYLSFLIIFATASAVAQNITLLDFTKNVQSTDSIYPNNSTLGPEYFSGLSFDFKEVATIEGGATIDARVTVVSTAGNYNFVGWIPDYNSAVGEPDGDLGVYYRHNGFFDPEDPLNPGAERFSSGGISYTISFFEGGGTFTTAAVMSRIGFLIYDFDGEAYQSEGIRTYESDGFSGYQTYTGSGITASDESGIWTFNSPGGNLSETGPEGSFIAYFDNTSTIRFDMFSTTSTNNPTGNNGVFAAFDGDLSLTNGTTGFEPLVNVPEPSSALLMAAAASVALFRRNRSVC